MRIGNFLIWVFSWTAILATSLLYCRDSSPPIGVILYIALSNLAIGWTSHNGLLLTQEQRDIDKARVERLKSIIGL